MQCRWLSIFNTLSHQNYFSRGYGGIYNTGGNSEGWRVTFVFKNGNSEKEAGCLHEIPSMVRVWIFSGGTH